MSLESRDQVLGWKGGEVASRLDSVALVGSCGKRELRLYLVTPGELCPIPSCTIEPHSKGNLAGTTIIFSYRFL